MPSTHLIEEKYLGQELILMPGGEDKTVLRNFTEIEIFQIREIDAVIP